MIERARLAVIAAGGTGGHLFPAQAASEALAARGWRIVLATDERTRTLAASFPAERQIPIASATLTGGPAARVGQVLTILRGVFGARRALKTMKPDVVVGFGGYPSIPTLLAARSLRLKTVIRRL